MEGGTLKGKKIEREQFFKAMETYYEMMCWDPEAGVPMKGKLSELDLDWLSQRGSIESQQCPAWHGYRTPLLSEAIRVSGPIRVRSSSFRVINRQIMRKMPKIFS